MQAKNSILRVKIHYNVKMAINAEITLE